MPWHKEKLSNPIGAVIVKEAEKWRLTTQIMIRFMRWSGCVEVVINFFVENVTQVNLYCNNDIGTNNFGLLRSSGFGK